MLKVFTIAYRFKRSNSGLAALETLLVLPLQIFMICVIVQIAHFIIAYQFVHYAAFAAGRAVLIEDTQRMKAGMNLSTGERAWKAAAHICSPLEVYSSDTGSWVALPTGGKFRDKTFERLGNDLITVKLLAYDARPDGDIQVQVTYAAHLPVPFANRVIYEAFKQKGEASSRDLRIFLTQSAIISKPWE